MVFHRPENKFPSFKRRERFKEFKEQDANDIEALCVALMLAKGYVMVWGNCEGISYINRALEPWVETKESERSEKDLRANKKRKNRL